MQVVLGRERGSENVGATADPEAERRQVREAEGQDSGVWPREQGPGGCRDRAAGSGWAEAREARGRVPQGSVSHSQVTRTAALTKQDKDTWPGRRTPLFLSRPSPSMKAPAENWT